MKACGKGGNSDVVSGEWGCAAEYCATPLATETLQEAQVVSPWHTDVCVSSVAVDITG